MLTTLINLAMVLVMLIGDTALMIIAIAMIVGLLFCLIIASFGVVDFIKWVRKG